MSNEICTFQGKITSVVHQKDAFCILLVSSPDYNRVISVKGNLMSPVKGDELLFKGKFEKNAVTGEFEISSYGQYVFYMDYATLPPIDDELGMISYCKRISGEKTGELIFQHFGMKTLEVLDHSPERLLEVDKIGEKTAGKILQKHRDFSQKEAYIELKKYGLTDNEIKRGLAHFGNDFPQKVKDNPYILVELDGFSFISADEVGIKLGVLPNDVRRIQYGAIFEMKRSAQNGHCYMILGTLSNLLSTTLKVSGQEVVNPLEISSVISTMCTKKMLIAEDNRIYLPNFYLEEVALAKRFAKILHGENRNFAINIEDAINKVVEEFKAVYGSSFTGFATQQKEFFYKLGSRLLLLTGYPGTGKTTVTRGALRILQMAFPDYEVIGMAPTGKASKRMKESLGIECVTVHRGLEYAEGGFSYHENNRMPKQIVFVDEFSMTDLFLCNSIVRALEDGAIVVFIGDPDQLPSVGAGKVLQDLLDCSDIIPTVRLTEIFRQARDSGIITNAMAVNEGKFPSIMTKKNDFKYVECLDPQEALDQLLEKIDLYTDALYTLEDIQILTPKKKGICGTESLNILLQEKLNPPSKNKKEYYINKTSFFREGDKVIQMRNDYNLNVTNGETGVVKAVREEITEEEDDFDNQKTITKELVLDVDFDGTIVTYKREELNNLNLGYAITIHKSQGSEWKVVMIPLTKEVGNMGKRNLLYTAITRAKVECWLFGDRKTIGRTVNTLDAEKRNTTLTMRIQQEYEELSKTE